MKKKIVRAALNAQLSAVAVATKTVNLSADAGAAAVELVLLPVLPASPFSTVDGRSGVAFTFDAASLVDRYNSGGRKANLNIEHNRYSGTDTRSRGFAQELTTADREPGLGMEPGLVYGWFNLSVLGADEMTQRLWLYTSAEIRGVWLDETTYQITKFDGHALTNNPATEMPANFSADEGGDASEDESLDAGYTEELTPEQKAMLTKILEQLGLTAETAEADVLARVAALCTPAASAAEQALTACGITAADLPLILSRDAELPVVRTDLATAKSEVTTLTAQVGTLTTDLAAARDEATALKGAEAKRVVFAAVDGAIAARKATPAQRDALVRIARADLTAFNEAMAAAPEVLSVSTPLTRSTGGNTFGLTAGELATAKASGISPETYASAREKARAQLGL
jgi:hypothetical protein